MSVIVASETHEGRRGEYFVASEPHERREFVTSSLRSLWLSKKDRRKKGSLSDEYFVASSLSDPSLRLAFAVALPVLYVPNKNMMTYPLIASKSQIDSGKKNILA